MEKLSPTGQRQELIRLSDLYLRGQMSQEDFRQAKEGLIPDYSAIFRKLDWWPGVQADLKDTALNAKESATGAITNFLTHLGRLLAR